MVLKNQNQKERYQNSVAILLLGLLVLVVVVRFGILLQRSESDLLSISNQIRGYNTNTITQTSHVKLLYQSGTGKVLSGDLHITGNNSTIKK